MRHGLNLLDNARSHRDSHESRPGKPLALKPDSQKDGKRQRQQKDQENTRSELVHRYPLVEKRMQTERRALKDAALRASYGRGAQVHFARPKSTTHFE